MRAYFKQMTTMRNQHGGVPPWRDDGAVFLDEHVGCIRAATGLFWALVGLEQCGADRTVRVSQPAGWRIGGVLLRPTWMPAAGSRGRPCPERPCAGCGMDGVSPARKWMQTARQRSVLARRLGHFLSAAAPIGIALLRGRAP